LPLDIDRAARLRQAGGQTGGSSQRGANDLACTHDEAFLGCGRCPVLPETPVPLLRFTVNFEGL
jgi:hypothetical protein